MINDSHVTVEAENVHLLVDELSQGDTAEGDAANESQQILKNYLVKNDQAETDDQDVYKRQAHEPAGKHCWKSGMWKATGH